MAGDYPDLPQKKKERIKRRGKKRRPKMGVNGRSVLTLAKIIESKAKGTAKKKTTRGKKKGGHRRKR